MPEHAFVPSTRHQVQYQSLPTGRDAQHACIAHPI